MLTILSTRSDSKAKAAAIHEWRKKNIPGYNATSWANENLKDAEYDKLYKHQTEALWQLPLAHDDKGLTVAKVAQLSVLPVEWTKITNGLESKEVLASK